MALQRFAGKLVLITGGNSGIGLATAHRVIEEGGRVVVTGRNLESLRRAQEELGDQAEVYQVDVSQIPEIQKLMDHLAKKYGHLDALFANAGVAQFAPIEAVTEADFDFSFGTNVKGVFFTLQKAIPLLKPGASVVINASVVASKGGELNSIYASTKAAVRSLARTFSSAYAQRGFRFNVISPGPIETPIWQRPEGGIPAAALQGMKQQIAAANPLKRYGRLDEIVAPIVFLLSSDSSYMLGAELLVDGGLSQL